MTVDELIKKNSSAIKSKKEYSFDKHLKRKYLPYLEKTSLVKAIIKMTSYKKVGDEEVYARNTSLMLFVFSLKLIETYTDITIDANNLNTEYDKLMESGVMNCLMKQIPEEEISILRGMLDMERDDLEVNTRSLVSFLENKAEAMKMALDGIASVLEKPEIKEKIAEYMK